MDAPKPRLLYIDDDEGLCRLTQKAMERRGYSVVVATDGVTGVGLAAAETFDVVALDHYMPGQDGLTTLGQLRELPSPPPIVYVTGSEETRIAVAALKAGAVDYVIKSTEEDFNDLLQSALDQALAKVQLTRERDIAEQALSEANANLEAVVARQLVLLREVNHRVANSLQLIASLVHMQAGAVKDEAAQSALRDTQARISAIMQIHRRLYTSENVEYVDMGEYLEGLVAELQQSLSSSHRNLPIRLNAESVTLGTDKAVSLGVIVAELVTNACKYAYGEDEDGEIRVALRHGAADTLCLVVEDDGRGFAEGVAPTGTGLGQKVIGAMARSLSSTMTFDPSHKGTRAVMAFPA
ncbi:MAG: sensor histidine kinase [Caulobacteraceae bacterium]